MQGIIKNIMEDIVKDKFFLEYIKTKEDKTKEDKDFLECIKTIEDKGFVEYIKTIEDKETTDKETTDKETTDKETTDKETTDIPEYGYIYLLYDNKNDRYKVGKTKQKKGLLNLLNFKIPKYMKIIIMAYIPNINELNKIKNKIIKEFNIKFKLVNGKNWFQGDCDEMTEIIGKIIHS